MLYTKEEREKIRKTGGFAKSNKVWNDEKLNTKKMIGSLMYLIGKSRARTEEEWVKFYFESGKERAALIKKGILGKKTDYDYGRTNEDLLKITKKLQLKLKCSFQLAYNYVYIRVIDETWIGYERELMALSKLKEQTNVHKSVKIKEATYEIDSKYAVDFEVFDENHLLFAIQLKSEKYRSSKNPGTLEAKKFNQKKNIEYTGKFKAPVIYLYMNDAKEITNMDDFLNILKAYIS